MQSLSPKTVLTITNGRFILSGYAPPELGAGEVDITDDLMRLAFEIADDGAWCSFQLRVEAGSIEWPFPVNAVNQYLGGGGTIETTPDAIEQIIVDGGMSQSAGEKVYEWLAAQGIVS